MLSGFLFGPLGVRLEALLPIDHGRETRDQREDAAIAEREAVIAAREGPKGMGIGRVRDGGRFNSLAGEESFAQLHSSRRHNQGPGRNRTLSAD